MQKIQTGVEGKGSNKNNTRTRQKDQVSQAGADRLVSGKVREKNKWM